METNRPEHTSSPMRRSASMDIQRCRSRSRSPSRSRYREKTRYTPTPRTMDRDRHSHNNNNKVSRKESETPRDVRCEPLDLKRHRREPYQRYPTPTPSPRTKETSTPPYKTPSKTNVEKKREEKQTQCSESETNARPQQPSETIIIEDHTEAHPLGCYDHTATVKQAVDLGNQQPSIIVGAPSASIAIDGGDFHTPVVVLYGSQATVLETSSTSTRDICDTLTTYTNSIDFSCSETKFQTEPSTRRNVSHYRYRMNLVANAYNNIVPNQLHAKYHKGALHFATTILGNPFKMSDGTASSWATLLSPRLTNIRGAFLILTSLKGNVAVCQPTVTRGGTQTTLVTYATTHVPPNNKMIKLDLLGLLFVPYKTPEYGITVHAVDDIFRANGIKFGIMTPVRRFSHSTIGIFSGLTWTTRTVIGETGQVMITFVAWFECTQENCYTLCRFWKPGPRAVYECMDHEISFGIENLYTVDGGKKLLGTLVVYSDSFTSQALTADSMPSMLVLRYELYGNQYKEPQLFFTTNPIAHLSWPSEETDIPAAVYASYDIIFKDGKHTFYLDLRYSGPNDRCFLVSSYPNEFRFHVSMTLWRPNSPLRFTMISPVSDLHVHRGTPIANIYLIHSTEGDIHQHNDYTALKLIKTGQHSVLSIGDLHLPKENFVMYDDI
ncbi:B31 [Murid betaherpesvirus 8]|uniref:B31 n=1 Tax=Rat cytomegalovirus (isolate England) TaxID=1261657 RepID=A0A0E3SY58_RCMVE|nr:B31 [Murid betaherpesvirus 8]WPH24947.1 B31 [Murid betaherpesvirus 8]WPH25081.1 B31 [Murid betaherpesvirus 8]